MVYVYSIGKVVPPFETSSISLKPITLLCINKTLTLKLTWVKHVQCLCWDFLCKLSFAKQCLYSNWYSKPVVSRKDCLRCWQEALNEYNEILAFNAPLSWKPVFNMQSSSDHPICIIFITNILAFLVCAVVNPGRNPEALTKRGRGRGRRREVKTCPGGGE